MRQYLNHSIVDRFIIGASGGRSDGDNIYFDGITKATVSVIVANDTVLTSALRIARIKLEDFAQKTPAEEKKDYFEPQSWQGLLQTKLVQHWQLSRTEIETELGNRLENYADTDLYLDEGYEQISLYFAYLNTPSICWAVNSMRRCWSDSSWENTSSQSCPKAFTRTSVATSGRAPYPAG